MGRAASEVLDARDRMNVWAFDGRTACGDGGDISTLRALLVDNMFSGFARNAAAVVAGPRAATAREVMVGGSPAVGGTGGDSAESFAESLEADAVDDGCDRVDLKKSESRIDENKDGARTPAAFADVDGAVGGGAVGAEITAGDSSVSGGGGGGGTSPSSSSSSP